MQHSGKNNSRLLQIAQLGSPILRKKAKKIIDFKNSELHELIDDLIATVMDVDGVGISAPQVFRSIQLFILASHPNARYPNAPYMKPTAIINPKIISFSPEIKKDWEGCLSIPGIRALIPRSEKIVVSYYSKDGVLHKKHFNDFIARIFQHEFDHLLGMVFLDRVVDSKDIISEKEYLRLMKKKKKNE